MLSGTNTFQNIADSPFVTDLLGLTVQNYAGAGYNRLSGKAGSAFEEHEFKVNSLFLYTLPWDDVLQPHPEASSARSVLTYEDFSYSEAYRYNNGTSMAAPMAAGIAAVIMGQKNLTVNETIALMKNSGKPLNALKGKTSTGKMVNLHQALGTKVTQPSVTESTYAYDVRFNTSDFGKLTQGDTITVAWPNEASVPGEIRADRVTINGVPVGTSAASLSTDGTVITFEVPDITIDHGQTVHVHVANEANLIIPSGTDYRVSVKTTTDPVFVTSSAFDVNGQTESNEDSDRDEDDPGGGNENEDSPPDRSEDDALIIDKSGTSDGQPNDRPVGIKRCETIRSSRRKTDRERFIGNEAKLRPHRRRRMETDRDP